MSALRQALQKKGFQPSSSQIREEKEAEASLYLAEEASNLSAGKRDQQRNKLQEQLSEISSVQKFRVLSKKLLLIDPQLAGEVVRIAHSRGIREKRKEGGVALIAQLIQTRNALQVSGLSEQEMSNIVNRTISKH